ncbi:MAG: histidinol-phosphate transaminase [Deltaproteobacteria bacterium]|jgi:histidinol-phosphate aminotransferase|nr:histidinol-phosphate transaminase [Deltaproteobacteria bacterium]
MTRPAPPVPEHIRKLSPYVPGRSIEEAMEELGLPGAVKLASNENCLGPSPRALDAMRQALEGVARYADAGATKLRKAISLRWDIPPESIVCGNGSSEFILVLAHALLRPGLNAVMSRPSFTLYAKNALATGAEAREAPLDADHGHDLKAILGRCDSRTRLVFMDNPLNPTGAFLTRAEINDLEKALPDKAVLVLDEAYADFSRQRLPDMKALVGLGRTVVLRTFSKLYGLAGVRAAWMAAPEVIADCVNRVRQPFNMNTLAQVGALAALEDIEHVRRTEKAVWDGLDFLAGALPPLGLETFPTQANFLMACSGPWTADELAGELFRKGLIVRSLSSFGYTDKIRITAGLPEENEALVGGIRELLDLRGRTAPEV